MGKAKSPKAKSPFVCPICGARLRYHRIDDGEAIVEITETGEVEEIGQDSNGSTNVYCTADRTHKISPEQWDEIVTLAEDEGY